MGRFDLLIKIPIPELAGTLKVIGGCAGGRFPPEWCRTFRKNELPQLVTLVDDIFVYYEGILAILDSPARLRTAERSRRTFLGFIGKLSKSLFGTATLDDVRRIAAKVLEIEEAVNKRGDSQKFLIDSVSKYVNQSNVRFGILKSKVDLNQATIAQMITTISQWQSYVTRSVRTTRDLFEV